jgi:hypothetical protein
MQVLLSWRNNRTATIFFFFGGALLRTTFILDSQASTSEAQWARTTLKEKFGEVWASRHRIIAAFERDTKLKHVLNRQSSASPALPTGDVAAELQEARALAALRRNIDGSLKSSSRLSQCHYRVYQS